MFSVVMILVALSGGLGMLSKCSYDKKVVAEQRLEEVVQDLETERNKCQGKMDKIAQKCEKWGEVDQAEKTFKIKVEQCQKLIRQAALDVVRKEQEAIR